MKRGFLIAVTAIAVPVLGACGGSGAPPSGERSQASDRSFYCPGRARDVVSLGPRAAKHAARVVLKREDPSEKPRVTASVPAPADGGRGDIAINWCGKRIDKRTMVVSVDRRAFHHGENKSASLAQGVFFVSRFPDGYRVWGSPHP